MCGGAGSGLCGLCHLHALPHAATVPPPSLPSRLQTPFMTVTRWQPGRAVTVPLSARMDRAQLLAELERHFPSPNLFYAIRLTGRFESLRARSVKKQKVDRWASRRCWLIPAGCTSGSLLLPSARHTRHLPPACRRPLVAVAKDQAVFELGAGSGTLVGFWSPPFMGSALTVPGFHLHFLSGAPLVALAHDNEPAALQPVCLAAVAMPESFEPSRDVVLGLAGQLPVAAVSTCPLMRHMHACASPWLAAEDKMQGGHLLEAVLLEGEAQIQVGCRFLFPLLLALSWRPGQRPPFAAAPPVLCGATTCVLPPVTAAAGAAPHRHRPAQDADLPGGGPHEGPRGGSGERGEVISFILSILVDCTPFE